MTHPDFSPLECARRAHKKTKALPGLDARILESLKEKNPDRLRLRAPLWVPVFTTCAVIALGLWLAPRKWGSFYAWSPLSDATLTGEDVRLLPVERQEFVTTHLPPAVFSLRLWENGETGVRSILDAGTVYQAAAGVELELLSPFAALEKSDETVKQISGDVRWYVDLPAGKTCMVEAAGWLFSAENATFSLDVSPQDVTVDVQGGEVTATLRSTPGEPRRLASVRAKLPAVAAQSAPAHAASHVWTRQEVERRLRSFSEKREHEAAAEFINRILPEVESGMRESLLFDLASIYGHYLHDWDRACQTLDRLVREFPSTSLMDGIQSLRSRYRCPPGAAF